MVRKKRQEDTSVITNIRMSQSLRYKLNLLATVMQTTQAGVIERLVDERVAQNEAISSLVAEQVAPYGKTEKTA
jgi:predicted transcriptional regulator